MTTMSSGLPPLPSELSAWTDARLVGQIAARGSAARAEQAEFYHRHAGYLYAVLKRQCAAALARSRQDVEDLVQDTFRRAFERAQTFRSDGVTGAEHERQRSRAWLGRIAKHLLLDALERNREVATELLDAALPSTTDSDPSPLLLLIEDALASLPEREQDVLRVFGLYYRAGEQNQRLPNAVSAALAARWATTPDQTLRCLPVCARRCFWSPRQALSPKCQRRRPFRSTKGARRGPGSDVPRPSLLSSRWQRR